MKNINRRKFIRSSLTIGSAAVLSSQFLPGMLYSSPPGLYGIASVPADNLKTAVEDLFKGFGGIQKFVSSGQSVGLLSNSPWKHPGYYTNPDVVLIVADLCREAGASEIIIFKPVPDGYWSKGKLAGEYNSLIESFSYCDERTSVSIPKGKELQKADVFKGFMDVDVFINIPVAKHHNGTIFSGNLKGMMGVSSSNTNRHMHSPDGEYTYDKHGYLAQCIADLNLIRKPDFCVVDATVCAQNNGPRGPGEIIEPNRLLGGTDPVALDVYAAELIDFDPEDILTTTYAHELGIGEINPKKLGILEM